MYVPEAAFESMVQEQLTVPLGPVVLLLQVGTVDWPSIVTVTEAPETATPDDVTDTVMKTVEPFA